MHLILIPPEDEFGGGIEGFPHLIPRNEYWHLHLRDIYTNPSMELPKQWERIRNYLPDYPLEDFLELVRECL